MKIAVHTPFDPTAAIAEAEIFARLAISVERMGWSCMRSSNSRAIEAFMPDIVLAEHFRIPKLTAFPTLGLMWNPPDAMGQQDHFLKNAISYDGWLFSDEATQRFHSDLAAPLFTRHVVGRWFPSCQETQLPTRSRAGIAYLASRWDGDRQPDLIASIKDRCDLRLYGPPKNASSGEALGVRLIPFDGTSLIEELNGRIASLCLHSDVHRHNGTPSARVFEAAAAGAIIISDENSFVRNVFGDAALYFDVRAAAADAADSVATHLGWLASHPDAAERMRASAHRIFVQQFSFECLLRQLPSLVEEVRNSWCASDQCADQSVSFIMRAGGRNLTFLDRAIGSLERQTHANTHALIVAYRNAADIRRWVGQRQPKLASITVVESPDNGMRSTSLWIGLAHIRSNFFGILDDDDTIMPNHVAACLAALYARPEIDVAFGGSILVDEDRHSDEPRSVTFFRRFDAEQLFRGNFITSNAWIARTQVLLRAGDDPMLPLLEDHYLLLRFCRGPNFAQTWRLSSEHYRRSGDMTRSDALGDDVQIKSEERLKVRTYFGSLGYRPASPSPPPPLSPTRLLRALRREVNKSGFKELWKKIATQTRNISGKAQ
jgi:hypothetical protein